MNNAHRMGDDDIRAGGAKIVGREPFENFVREPVRGGERKIERGRVRDPAAVRLDAWIFCSSASALICADAP